MGLVRVLEARKPHACHSTSRRIRRGRLGGRDVLPLLDLRRVEPYSVSTGFDDGLSLPLPYLRILKLPHMHVLNSHMVVRNGKKSIALDIAFPGPLALVNILACLLGCDRRI
jgi:hypothetical protein